MSHKTKSHFYLPPTPDSISRYAKEVCNALAEMQQKDEVAKPEIATGFAHLLSVLFHIRAKELNGELEKGRK